MAKKKDDVEELEETVEEETEEAAGPIAPISHDFLREDLNEVRDKLNQVIEVVNNL